jgi:glycosyltransferase involved in cell wall biosynthesis
MTAPGKTDISVIVPVLNEAESLPELERQVREACVRLSRTYEIIFVDDGSTDGTFEVLKGLRAANPLIRVVRFRKNFGQTAALAAGFDRARGEIILTLDADLQNDPADFPILLAKLDQGYDIVSGWRQKRKDRFVTRRLPSIAANWLISRITGVKLHDYGCTLKAFRRDVIKNIRLYGELHRFIPAIASKMGVAVAEVKVNHRPRRHGRSKYNIFRTVRVVLDLLTVKFLLSYSTRPLQIFGIFGLVSLVAGSLISGWLAYERLVLRVAIGGRPLLLLAILLILIGIQFITLGLLAEIMVRAYHEAAHQPTYFVREVLDDEPEGRPGKPRS